MTSRAFLTIEPLPGQEPKPLVVQRSGGNLQQLKVSAASAGVFADSSSGPGSHRLSGAHGFFFAMGNRPAGATGSPATAAACSPVASPQQAAAALTYQSLYQASAPDLGCPMLAAAAGCAVSASAAHRQWVRDSLYAGAGAGAAGAGWSCEGVLPSGAWSPADLVQRSANSAVVSGRVYQRCVYTVVEN